MRDPRRPRPKSCLGRTLDVKVGVLLVAAVVLLCVVVPALSLWHNQRCKDPRTRLLYSQQGFAESRAPPINLSATLPSLTQFAAPFQVWAVQTRTQPSFTLAVYRYPDGRWEEFADIVVSRGLFEPGETLLMEQLLAGACNRSALVVDVGGFVGSYTMLAASKGCRVHVWEGSPQNVAMLELGVALNGLQSRVVVHPNICSAGKAPLRFIGTAMDGHVATTYNQTDNPLRQDQLAKEGRLGDDGNGVLVYPLAIGDVISSEVHLMKVDVEGYEPHVFASAHALLSARKVKYIMFEFNMWRAMTKAQGVELVMSLLSWKYSVYKLAVPPCGWHQFTTRQQVEAMASQLQNNTYKCGSWAINLVAARDGLPPAVLSGQTVEPAQA